MLTARLIAPHPALRRTLVDFRAENAQRAGMIRKHTLATVLVLALAVCGAFLWRSHRTAHASGATGSGHIATMADVDARLESMSLDDKVGQVFMGWFRGAEPDAFARTLVLERRIGGMCLFDAAGNITGPTQVARLSADIQDLARQAGLPGVLLSVDQEGGPVARLRKGFAVMPSNMAVGATGDPHSAGLAAAATAAQLTAVGLHMNLAPVLDVNSNPANPVIGIRSFGSDPEAVAAMGAAALDAYRRSGVVAVVKHFPGHGDTGMDSHLGLPLVPHDMERLERVELVPFRRAIKDGAEVVMTAHVRLPAVEPEPVPATLSRAVLTGLLRRRLGFDGVIVTDSMGMGAVSGKYGVGEAAVRAFEAGVDLLLYGADKGHEPKEILSAMTALKGAVMLGRVSMERLDASVRRILALKARHGLLEPPTGTAPAAPLTDTGAQRAVADALAARSVTLVHDRGVLPLTPGSRVLLVWPEAQNDPVEAIGGHDGLEVLRLPPDPGPADVQRARAAARRARAVVLFTSRSDRRHGQAAVALALTEAMAEVGGAGPVVCAMDEPYGLPGLVALADPPCVLAAYSNVAASVRAVLDVVYGRTQARGAMPVALE